MILKTPRHRFVTVLASGFCGLLATQVAQALPYVVYAKTVAPATTRYFAPTVVGTLPQQTPLVTINKKVVTSFTVKDLVSQLQGEIVYGTVAGAKAYAFQFVGSPTPANMVYAPETGAVQLLPYPKTTKLYELYRDVQIAPHATDPNASAWKFFHLSGVQKSVVLPLSAINLGMPAFDAPAVLTGVERDRTLAPAYRTAGDVTSVPGREVLLHSAARTYKLSVTLSDKASLVASGLPAAAQEVINYLITKGYSYNAALIAAKPAPAAAPLPSPPAHSVAYDVYSGKLSGKVTTLFEPNNPTKLPSLHANSESISTMLVRRMASNDVSGFVFGSKGPIRIFIPPTDSTDFNVAPWIPFGITRDFQAAPSKPNPYQFQFTADIGLTGIYGVISQVGLTKSYTFPLSGTAAILAPTLKGSGNTYASKPQNRVPTDPGSANGVGHHFGKMAKVDTLITGLTDSVNHSTPVTYRGKTYVAADPGYPLAVTALYLKGKGYIDEDTLP